MLMLNLVARTALPFLVVNMYGFWSPRIHILYPSLLSLCSCSEGTIQILWPMDDSVRKLLLLDSLNDLHIII
jgi:hypothetical protein